MWPAVVSLITEGFKSFMQHRQAKAQAKHERDLRIIDSEDAHDALVSQGWKDEYLTILFTAPIIVIFWGAFFNDPEKIKAAADGINAVGTLPEWYQMILGTIVLGSFSLRGYHAWKKYKRQGLKADKGEEE